MKSPEQMGGLPEQTYNKEWEKLKKGGPAFAVREGRKLGVPREELNRFIEEVVGRAIEGQKYAFVYRFMISLGIGTKETARSIGEQGYRFFMGVGDFGSAMNISEDVYGRDSEEWRRASEKNEKDWEKTKRVLAKREEQIESGEWNPFVTLSQDATFADLFNAIDGHKESEELANYFTQELWDHFSSEIETEVLAFRDVQADKAAITKVVDFFKKHGYSQSDILAFLPIKFKSERRSK